MFRLGSLLTRPPATLSLAPLLFALAVGVTATATAQKAPPRPANGYRFGHAPAPPPSPPRAAPGAPKTHLDITILTPRFGGQVEAQRWAKRLGDLGYSAQLRQAVLGDEIGVKETTRGTLRSVTILGTLEPSGVLNLGDRSFTANDGAALAEWLNQLAAYGAQGAPDGQPLWGLTKEQFGAVYAALSPVVEAELEDLPFREALAKLPVPAAHPLRISSAAEAWLTEHPAQPVRNRVASLSCGTALAVVLREAGLGVRPLRTPAGSIELSIEPLSQLQMPWPVGWELEDPTRQSDHAPNLFKFVEIGFTDAALQDVLDACAAAVEVPILTDDHGLKDATVDPATLLVSFPTQKTTWSLMLNTSLHKAGLVKQVRTDELGKAFVYVTPFVPKVLERVRD
jgi:hypothetical protein